MEEKKDEKEMCGGCAGCAKPENACSWGEGLARDAIADMGRSKDTDGPEENDSVCLSEKEALERDIEAFLEECEAKGSSPMDVAAHIAKSEGIDLSGDPPKAESGKRKLHIFLREVVRRLILALAAHVAEQYGLSMSSLLKMAFGASGASGASARSADGPQDEGACRVIGIRIVPVRFGYSFTW